MESAEKKHTSFDGVNPMKLAKVANSLPISKNLKTTLKLNSIEKFIYEELLKLPNYHSYKNDISILLRACNLVENLITKRKQGDIKEQTVINVFSKLFSLNHEEILSLKNNIRTLIETKQIIKLSKVYRIVKQSVLFFLKHA
jgi:hypothetical protein